MASRLPPRMPDQQRIQAGQRAWLVLWSIDKSFVIRARERPNVKRASDNTAPKNRLSWNREETSTQAIGEDTVVGGLPVFCEFLSFVT